MMEVESSAIIHHVKNVQFEGERKKKTQRNMGMFVHI